MTNSYKKEYPFVGYAGFGGGVGALSAKSSATKTYVDDVFSTYVYAGNSSTQSIDNGIDLSGEGGMTWIKGRDDTVSHFLYDTVRGAGEQINTDSNTDKHTDTNRFSSFNSNGFTLGNNAYTNDSSYTYSSWSFRKAKGFFDVVTYTGTGSDQNISHSLGSIPGMILVKRTDSSANWGVYHRGQNNGDNPWNYRLRLDTTDTISAQTYWAQTAPTATHFSVGDAHTETNASGATYVAYVFADVSSKEATSRSVYFDGSSDYLLSTSSDYSPGTGDFTMEAWVNIESGVAATDGIYQLSSTSGAFTYGGIALLYKKSASENRWELYGGNSTNQSESTTFTGYEYGKWVHTAIVKTSGNIKLYINGEERISATDTQNYSGYQYLGLGSAFSSTQNFKGNISNFKLTIGEALYTSDFTPTNVPLTTTSQSSTASNVKILCCNNSSVTGKTVGDTITSNGTVTASTDNPNFIETEASIFGDARDQGIIKCGSYSGGTAGKEINIGFEPQFVLLKAANYSQSWRMIDMMRGFTTKGLDDKFFNPNENSAEHTDNRMYPTPTGFGLDATDYAFNGSGGDYIYIAIRRPDGYVGKPAEAGTDVFTIATGNGSSTIPNFTSNFPVDLSLIRNPTSTASWWAGTRLTQGKEIKVNGTGAQNSWSYNVYDSNIGWQNYSSHGSSEMSWMWKRHAGFDVVTYKGDHVDNRKIPHSLSKSPEMIWTKVRDTSGENWVVWHTGLTSPVATAHILLNLTNASANAGLIYGGSSAVAPTSTHWSVGTHETINDDNYNYMAMLFTSVTGISKCGYYSGSGSSGNAQNIGFSPRFLIIKHTNGADPWMVFDTTRGINNSGDDKLLYLNSSDSQDTTHDWISISSTGFSLSDGNGATNASGGSYIYYAHS